MTRFLKFLFVGQNIAADTLEKLVQEQEQKIRELHEEKAALAGYALRMSHDAKFWKREHDRLFALL